MNLFRSRTRSQHQLDRATPAAREPVRFSDPVARAMHAGDRRSADVMWFGGVTFRAEADKR
jgi:hypothetical protein